MAGNLLTYDWKPASTDFVTSLVQSAQRNQLAERARAGSAALQLVSELQRRQELEKRMDFEAAQEERLIRHFNTRQQFDQAKEIEDRRRWDAENAPYTGPGVGATGGSVAAGLPATAPAVDAGTAPDPNGLSPSNTDPLGTATPPLSPSAELIGPPLPPGHPAAAVAQVAPPTVDPSVAPAGQVLPPSSSIPAPGTPAMAPAARLRAMASDLAELGVTKKQAGQILASAAPAMYRNPAGTSRGPTVRNVAGDLVQMDPTTGEWNVVYEGPDKPDKPITRKVGEDLFQWDPEGKKWNQVVDAAEKKTVRGTYKGDDGKLYTQFSNGQWDMEPPAGVNISRIGSEPRKSVKMTVQDAAGNRYSQFSDGSWDKEPPAGTKLERIASPQKSPSELEKETALMRQEKQWTSEAATLEKQLATMPQPRWPWVDKGQYYRSVAEGEPAEKIDETTFKSLMAKEQAKADALNEKRMQVLDYRRRAADTRAEIDGGVPTTVPAAVPTPAAPPSASPAAAPAAPAGGRPVPPPPDVVEEAKKAMPRKGRNAVLAKLQSLGYDTTGL